MGDAIRFGVLGLGTAGAYGLLALGLLVIYRGTGIINFAQGAFAMVSAFIFWDMGTNHGVSLWLAAAIAILITTVGGILVDLLIMRKLRQSSPLVRLIGTLAVMLGLTSAGLLVWGSQSQFVNSLLPQNPVTIDLFGVTVTMISDRLIIIGVVVLLAVLLSIFYRRVLIGIAMTASAENEPGVAALGWSPNLLATASWALGATLAGIAGVLIAPLTSVQVEPTSLLVLPALAAALFGSFTSVSGVLVGAVIIGVVQSEVAEYGASWFGAAHSLGLSDAVPLVIIILVLIVRGVSLPLRGHVLERLPALGGVSPIRIVFATAGVVVVLSLLVSTNILDGLLASSVACLIVLSLVVLTGYTGQISLGQFALAGMGAFVAVRLVANVAAPFLLALAGGIVATIFLGLLFALPALRTRGVNLAIITLGLGVALNSVVFQNAAYTGGLVGITVPQITVFGLSLNPVTHEARYVVFSIVCVVIAVLVVRNVRRSSAGRRMIAVRSNERAAASLGINPIGIKFYAFGLSAAIAAFGGIVLAFSNRTIVFTNFDPLSSINALLYATVGGVGFIGGSVVGSQMDPNAVVGQLISSRFANAADWIGLIGALLVLLTLATSPDGSVAVITRFFAAHRKHRPVELRNALRPPPDINGTLPEISMRAATLQAHDLRLTIGRNEILRGVDVRVDPGQIVGLIGPNGAGKTMCIDVITGFVNPTGGQVSLGGEDITIWSPSRRVRAGMTRSFQSLELFEDMSVLDNLRAASDVPAISTYFTDLCRTREPLLHPTASAAIEQFQLAIHLDSMPSDLSYGDRRLVSIARAVATNPSVLLLDEPAAGLSDSETAELASLLQRLARGWGIGILLVEHDMTMVMSICDDITVLDFGRVIASGTAEQIRANDQVIKAYLGSLEDVPDPELAPSVESA